MNSLSGLDKKKKIVNSILLVGQNGTENEVSGQAAVWHKSITEGNSTLEEMLTQTLPFQGASPLNAKQVSSTNSHPHQDC